MTEGRIQDWIRYVQENAENVAETSQASTREDVSREDVGETPEVESGAQAAEKRVAASLRARRIASSRLAVAQESAPPADESRRDAVELSARVQENAAGSEVVKAPAARISRQRIRPETRAQMLDRLTNPTISLHEASVLLNVCSATVRRLCDSGALPHERTAGGQRRFRLAEVMKLYRARRGERTSK
jgi:excisionase family DNA binding protein